MMLTCGIGSSKWKVALATVVFKLNEGNIFKLISTLPPPPTPSPTAPLKPSAVRFPPKIMLFSLCLDLRASVWVQSLGVRPV